YNGPLGIGWVPPAYTSYEKNFAGWLDYTVLGHKPLNVTGMKPLQEGGEAYAIYNPRNHDEYYLLENKGGDKWDSHLPTHGLLVLHVDYDASLWAYNIVNNTEHKQYNTHQRLTIVPAAASYGNADRDTYPLGKRDSLTANSTPALTLYNANWDNGHILYNKVLNIRKDDNGLISFNYLPDPHFNTAGIEPAFKDNRSATIVSIYSMWGQRMPTKRFNGLPRGLYLLNLSDGTTRKILVN
ncbi:MAG: peptidase, partial [Hoylesella buccalis]